ncbi:hypothetical protein GCM10010276_27270 [Streptomyces longisporus]|uniref:Transposase n=1 Tax=Streptomyces longisporus TaxID=1948 RepID=A0ABN3LNX7_STRLO
MFTCFQGPPSRSTPQAGTIQALAEALTRTALVISHRIENTTGWSVKRFVKTARRYRTIQIKTGEHTLTAADPLPDDLRAALDVIRTRSRGH